MLTQILNHAALAVARLAAQFTESPKLKGMITALSNEVQAAEDGLFPILLTRDIENAVNAALDSIGQLVGAPTRGPLSDTVYRDRVKTQVLINRSYGTLADVYGVAKRVITAWNVDGQPHVLEDALCGYTVGCDPLGSVVNDTQQAIDLGIILDDMNSAGVRGIVLSQTQSAATSFCFANGAGLGFGAGHFVGAYDSGKSH